MIYKDIYIEQQKKKHNVEHYLITPNVELKMTVEHLCKKFNIKAIDNYLTWTTTMIAIVDEKGNRNLFNYLNSVNEMYKEEVEKCHQD